MEDFTKTENNKGKEDNEYSVEDLYNAYYDKIEEQIKKDGYRANDLDCLISNVIIHCVWEHEDKRVEEVTLDDCLQFAKASGGWDKFDAEETA